MNRTLAGALALFAAVSAAAQENDCLPLPAEFACVRYGPETPATLALPDPCEVRAETVVTPPVLDVDRYAYFGKTHRLSGNACYYSGFFHGRKTANGEIFRHDRLSAAHLTLPLGTWVEITARTTGNKVRLRVNDRGPYTGPFIIDLSKAAAKALGVDVARDRHVEVKVIALPGEAPPGDLEPDDAPDRRLPRK